MKLSRLLAERQALLQQTRLANLAFAYRRLNEFATRITRARLSGDVCLQQAAPDTECYQATLTALGGNQSVIEEHFTDEDLMDFADIVAFITHSSALELTFRIEELPEKFVGPLRIELQQAGVSIDQIDSSAEPNCESTHGQPREGGGSV
jgi:hypothetical protein